MDTLSKIVLLSCLLDILPTFETNPNPSAVFFFGDSFADTGNNNNIPTLLKCNFPPYGVNFKDRKSTGRCSDGKLLSDVIASGLGVKQLVPPYLDPDLQEEDLVTGVTFASIGTGVDNLTAATNAVIPFLKELDLFKEYINRLQVLTGTQEAQAIVSSAIAFITVGNNDLGENYYILPTRSSQFTLSQYVEFLLDPYSTFIQELYNLGVRHIGVINLPPLGCLPLFRTRDFVVSKGECSSLENKGAQEFNINLLRMVSVLNSTLPLLEITYLDYYTAVADLIFYPKKYGFEEVRKGWCSTGLVEGVVLCNKVDEGLFGKDVDPSRFVFFDSVHLTEKAYSIVLESLLPKIRSTIAA